MARPSCRHVVTVLAGATWIGSWYLMHLEITRWRHVRPTLSFDPGPVRPDGVRPRPGGPLIALYVACVAAPTVVVVGVLRDARVRRAVRALSRW